MNVKNNMYFFSTEAPISKGPVKCNFIKELHAEVDKEVALLECESEISEYNTKYLVIVPIDVDYKISTLSSSPIFVYVLDGQKFVNNDQICLSNLKGHILDKGGVTIDYKIAQQWQYVD